MHRSTHLIVTLLLVGVSVSTTHAHPGHSHRKKTTPAGKQTATNDRIWSTAAGGFREQGAFVMSREGYVQIRRPDDSLVILPWESLTEEDRVWVSQRMSDIRHAADVRPPGELLLAQRGPNEKGPGVRNKSVPEIANAFDPFVKLKAIQTRWDDRFFYVESNGMPDHPLMVGITAWQQQVPLPQKYFGDNAWRIPLRPVPAKNPQSAKNDFLRGAIALAVNGIPIFNPLNNRGDDAFLFGELDEFGGHCGRADDYHYHIAPVHLEKTIGKGLPIAYALDGYPIYGYEEPDGSPVKGLDDFNGHEDANGNYHYHATKTYPYLNGGFHGEVVKRDGQVDPQPRAEPVRPSLPPMKGAKITGFQETKAGSYLLTYEVAGKKGTVGYTLGASGSATFTFTFFNDTATTETYSPRQRGPGGRDRQPPPRGGNNPPPRDDNRPRRGDNRPPRKENSPARRNEQRPPDGEERPAPNAPPGDAPQRESNLPRLTVTSSSIDGRGFLTVDCTCDGASQSPAVAWKDAPPGTKSFAVSLWHIAPDQEKSYWLVYNIPSDVSKLAQNAKPAGTLGLNDKRRAAYDPLCSKGPGVKEYHITVFALSAEPQLDPDKANRAALLAAIKEITLAEGTLTLRYERRN